jgi:hypothetical protein
LVVGELAYQITPVAVVVLEAVHLTQAMRQGLLGKEMLGVKAA